MGEGNLDSHLVFLGEAPGRREDETGRPFVGSAGKLLDQLLAGVNLSRCGVFITNVVRCRPPRNRKPRKEEITACSTHIEGLLEIIKPEIIAPMGNSALEHVFERFGIEKSQIGSAHGKAYKVETSWGKVIVYPLYHPAAAIYNRRLLGDLKKDMAALAKFLS
jgi:DNA polymerase